MTVKNSVLETLLLLARKSFNHLLNFFQILKSGLNVLLINIDLKTSDDIIVTASFESILFMHR